MKHLTLLGSVLFVATSATAQWALTVPIATPGGLVGHGMTFGPNLGGVLVYGGDTLSGPFGSLSSATWTYDGTTWTQITTPTTPHATAGIRLVYDRNRALAVMYGGAPNSPFGGAAVDRTWEYNGSDWSEAFPTNSPGGRAYYAMAYNSASSRTVLYGGMLSTLLVGDSDQTWEWDGTNWTQTALAGTPGPLERASMCYHAGLDRCVMFGGIDVLSGGVDTTWIYDGSSWSAAGVAGTRPSVRTGQSMIYDPVRQVCVMTGGQDPTNGNPFDDTWEFDLASLSWTQTGPDFSTGRRDHGMAFDFVDRKVVLYGGMNNQQFMAFDDTWEYGASMYTFGGGCPGSNGTPALDSTTLPRVGDTFSLDATNLNAAISLGIFVIGLTEIPGGVSLSSIGMPGCTAFVTPDLLYSVTGSGGAANFTFVMPSASAAIGTSVFSQTISFDPAINPAWLTVSNAHAALVGG